MWFGPGWFWLGRGLVPGQSADVSQTVEDSEHSKTNTWDPQHTGTLNTETGRLLPWIQTGTNAVTIETDGKQRLTITIGTDRDKGCCHGYRQED